MRKETFNAVGSGGNLWIGEVMEYVQQRSLDGEVRTPQQLMCVPVAAHRFMEGFLLQVCFVAAVPL